MSTNFWDVKTPDEQETIQESVTNKGVSNRDIIGFSNPLEIDIDGARQEIVMDNPNELNELVISLILSAEQFWIIQLTPGERFFQMDVRRNEFEYWADGAMKNQQSGNIDQALNYLESIIENIPASDKPENKADFWTEPETDTRIPLRERKRAMQDTDVAKLQSSETPETHHFYNFVPLGVFLGLVLFVGVISEFALPVVLTVGGVVGTITGLYAYFTHTKILYFRNHQTYVWFQGKEVMFVYVKEQSDKLLTWTEVRTSTDSDGDTTKTYYYHFRIIDEYGGELFTGTGAGARPASLRHRDRLEALLGLETLPESVYKARQTKSDSVTSKLMREQDIGSDIQSLRKALALFAIAPILFVSVIVIFVVIGEFGEDVYYDEGGYPQDMWDYIEYYCSNDGADYAYQMGGELCPDGHGITPVCPNGQPCICVDIDDDCFDGDDDWGFFIDFEYGSTDRWCNNAENYPVTTPIEIVSATEIGSNEENRAMWPNNDLSYAINGGVCDYVYQTGESTSFEFVFNLVNTSDIDGISILYIDAEWTSGYSGIEIFTSGVNNTEWTKRYSSEKMYGEYERYATYEEPAADFGMTAWYRHAFNETVTNVSQVKIVTGVADQAGDTSVSFTGLRVDAAGDYNYPDYFLCNGTWDGQFENSTSELILWDDLPRPYHLGCTDMEAQEE